MLTTDLHLNKHTVPTSDFFTTPAPIVSPRVYYMEQGTLNAAMFRLDQPTANTIKYLSTNFPQSRNTVPTSDFFTTPTPIVSPRVYYMEQGTMFSATAHFGDYANLDNILIEILRTENLLILTPEILNSFQTFLDLIDSLVVSFLENQNSLCSLLLSDTLTTLVSEDKNILSLLQTIETLNIQLQTFSIVANVIQTSDSSNISLIEIPSAAIMLLGLDSLITSLTEVCSFFNLFTSSDILDTYFSEIPNLLVLIQRIESLLNSLTESTSTFSQTTSGDNTNIVLDETVFFNVLLSVTDSLTTIIQDIGSFFQDLFGADQTVINLQEFPNVALILEKTDSILVSLETALSFFKGFRYSDEIVSIDESTHTRNEFGTIDNILVTISTLRELLVLMQNADISSMTLSEEPKTIESFLEKNDTLILTLLDVLNINEKILVQLGNIDILSLQIEDIQQIKNSFSSIESLEISVLENYNLFLDLLKHEDISLSLLEEIKSVEAHLKSYESIDINDNIKNVFVELETVSDGVTISALDNTVYNFLILALLKKVHTFLAIIEKIQYVCTISKKELISDIEKKSPDAAVKETNIVIGQIDKKK